MKRFAICLAVALSSCQSPVPTAEQLLAQMAQEPKVVTPRPPDPKHGVTRDRFAKMTSVEELNDVYTLQIEDCIRLLIVQDGDPMSLWISDTGMVNFPHIGPIQAAGLTCKQFASLAKRELEKKYFKEATVLVVIDADAPRPGVAVP